jgi:hypothetical protein
MVQSLIPPSLTASIEIFPFSMIMPRYSILVWQNSHFLAFRKRLCFRSFSSTSLVILSSSSFVSAKMRMSSMYSLKGCRGITHSEKHHGGFEKSFVCLEGRFPFVSFSDSYIVVAPTHIQFGEVFCTFRFVHYF